MVSVKSIRRIGAAAAIPPVLDHLIGPTMGVANMPALMESAFGPDYVAAVIFFIVLGVFQLIWIGVLLKSNNSSLLVLGVVGNLFSVLIYFVSAAGVTMPFRVPPQPIFPFAILIKASEAVFILASVYVLKSVGLVVA